MISEIEKRIKLLGLKKSHVAKRIGLSPAQFSHYLKDRRQIEDSKLFALKKYLGIN